MRKTAILRPLTPRTTTSLSSPPRTNPKAPRKRSSVWSTAHLLLSARKPGADPTIRRDGLPIDAGSPEHLAPMDEVR